MASLGDAGSGRFGDDRDKIGMLQMGEVIPIFRKAEGLDREAIRQSLREAAARMHEDAKTQLFKAELADEEDAIATARARLHLTQTFFNRQAAAT